MEKICACGATIRYIRVYCAQNIYCTIATYYGSGPLNLISLQETLIM